MTEALKAVLSRAEAREGLKNEAFSVRLKAVPG